VASGDSENAEGAGDAGSQVHALEQHSHSELLTLLNDVMQPITEEGTEEPVMQEEEHKFGDMDSNSGDEVSCLSSSTVLTDAD
jgi:hypothetical protein